MSAQTLIDQHPVGFGITWLHPCALHGEDEGWYRDDESIPGCPDCGCMLETEECIWCGANWISVGDNQWDDVIRSAGITSSGDLLCARCAAEEEEEENQDYSEDWEDDFP
jgi:hypothetical protein